MLFRRPALAIFRTSDMPIFAPVMPRLLGIMVSASRGVSPEQPCFLCHRQRLSDLSDEPMALNADPA